MNLLRNRLIGPYPGKFSTNRPAIRSQILENLVSNIQFFITVRQVRHPPSLDGALTSLLPTELIRGHWPSSRTVGAVSKFVTLPRYLLMEGKTNRHFRNWQIFSCARFSPGLFDPSAVPLSPGVSGQPVPKDAQQYRHHDDHQNHLATGQA